MKGLDFEFTRAIGNLARLTCLVLEYSNYLYITQRAWLLISMIQIWIVAAVQGYDDRNYNG